MKGIMLSVDEKVLAAAQGMAAERGTTVDAIVRERCGMSGCDAKRVQEAA